MPTKSMKNVKIPRRIKIDNETQIKMPYGLNLLTYYDAVLLFVTTVTLLIMIVPYDKKSITHYGEFYIVGIGLPIIIVFGVYSSYLSFMAYRDFKPKNMICYFAWKFSLIALITTEGLYHACNQNIRTREETIIEAVLKIAPIMLLLFSLFTLVIAINITLFIRKHAEANRLAYANPIRF